MSPSGAGLALVSSSLVTVSLEANGLAIFRIYSPLLKRVRNTAAGRCRYPPSGCASEQRDNILRQTGVVHLSRVILVECPLVWVRREGATCRAERTPSLVSETIRIDLHCHSSASDGDHSPAHVARRLADIGVTWASLTDHNTVGGQEEFRAALARRWHRLYPGRRDRRPLAVRSSSPARLRHRSRERAPAGRTAHRARAVAVIGSSLARSDPLPAWRLRVVQRRPVRRPKRTADRKAR